MARRRLDPRSVSRTASATLAAVDSGVVQVINEDALVLTLPSTAIGLKYIFEVGGKVTNLPVGAGANKTVGFSIDPAAADGITGGSLATPVVNKDLLYAKTTSVVGDRIEIIGTGTAGTAAWIIQELPPAGVTRQP